MTSFVTNQTKVVHQFMNNNRETHHIIISKKGHHVVFNSNIRSSLFICGNVSKITHMSGCLIISRSPVCSLHGVKVPPSSFTILGQIPLLMDMESVQARGEVEYYSVDSKENNVDNNLLVLLSYSVSLPSGNSLMIIS